MSLAIYAAPFNNEKNNSNSYNLFPNDDDTPINKKRNGFNKTQKRIPGEFSSDKVSAVLQSIHSNNNSDTDDTDNNLGDYNPLAPPTSAGVENTKLRENFSDKNSTISPLEKDDVDLKSLQDNYLNDKAVEKYFKNIIPNYNQSLTDNNTQYNKPYYPSTYYSPVNNDINKESENNKILMDKLNYMINLLEENQDIKTNNVTEEVVLYSFLGIFIIFIVDSFARVGKYVR